MDRYSGHYGLVEKFGKTWVWTRYGRYEADADGNTIYKAPFRVEPHYEIDLSQPRWRPGEEGSLTMTITVRGTPYTFPAIRLPCPTCDGGIRCKLKLRPHGGVCYCDSIDFTIIDFYHDKMTDEQKITVATYHLDLQMSSSW